jgi:hypothetical protein
VTPVQDISGGFPAGPHDSDAPSATSPVYLAVQLLPGMEPGDLAEIQLALADAARRITATGRPVRYVHGMYLPPQTRLLCMFTAENKEAVHAAARLAQVLFTQVDAAPASQLTAPPVQ